jgi:hypothetical protein
MEQSILITVEKLRIVLQEELKAGLQDIVLQVSENVVPPTTGLHNDHPIMPEEDLLTLTQVSCLVPQRTGQDQI